ncbi:esterase B1 [Drosophila innubila]|uniref:esterase B1 n=1 Tax=Drosophila innubila TaxID=198719 RepID=UPI00148C7E08|nr:esterase B1 [Drosophila innubila]
METDYKETNPVHNTTHGPVRGVLRKSMYDELYYSFDGIPYAQPPLGELRFKEPQDATPWNGVLDCTQPRDKCLQVNRRNNKVEGSEDCLYLNIAVKRLSSDKPLPVMVYVHGGAFKSGDPSSRAWSPEFLMREDVIYISIGYRLGAFGHLSFADPSLGIPGNSGLKDIVLALKWIKANVKYFNGNENNITLFGHSSGSMLVQLLSVSPQTEGLFNKFILMAGFLQELNRLPNIEYRLAQKLGYQGENIDNEVYNFIKSADPNLLASADILTEFEKCHSDMITTCTPNVEHYETPAGLILREPRELQRKAWSNRIPLMLGTTSDDGFSVSLEILSQHPEVLLPRTLLFLDDAQMRRQLGKKLVESVCQVDINDLSEAHLDSLKKVKTYCIMHNQHRLINARLAYGKADNYLYRFDFDSPDCNFYRIRRLGPDSREVTHGDDLCYLFKIPDTFKLDKSRAEYATICRMASMFVEFALRSNPNSPLTQTLVNWKPVTPDEPNMCLNINEELRFIPQPELQSLQFFDKLFEEAGVDLI